MNCTPRSDGDDGSAAVAPVIEISLLGTFGLRVGGEAVTTLPSGAQRLLAFLALHERPVARAAIAAAMWPDVSAVRAGASLRSALSRLGAQTHQAVLVAPAGLRLAETVVVDLRTAQAMARRLLRRGAAPKESDLGPAALAALSAQLLPDWHDEWVLEEAEDWRQLRVNALEEQARLLTAHGHLAEAAASARAAVRVEALRESAHASLLRVHLAEGNPSEALRVFERYRTLLSRELGLEPTVLADLVADIRKP